MKERRNSIANALELRLFCTNPSTLSLACIIVIGAVVIATMVVPKAEAHSETACNWTKSEHIKGPTAYIFPGVSCGCNIQHSLNTNADTWYNWMPIHIATQLHHVSAFLCALSINCLDSWRHHNMDTFPGLLGTYDGNYSLSSQFPHQGPVMRIYFYFFVVRLIKLLSKRSSYMCTCYFRRHKACG